MSTTAQPAASAGAILCATRLSGKLNGLIAPTTPIGRRRVNASLPSPAWDASIGTISPASVRASTADIVYVDMARATSTRAAFSGLPASAAISRAASSARRPSAPATRTRISARLCAGSGSRIARSAASTAARASAAPAFATRATGEPSYGEATSTQSPVSTHSPSTRSIRSGAVAAIAANSTPTPGGTVDRMAEAYVVDAVRTPIGRRNGMLAGVRADELAAQVLNGLVARLDVEPGEIEDVQMGCVSQVGEQALNIGRMSALVAGWPETVCGTSVDRQCGSSMQAAFNATAAVQAGHLDVVVAAGVESMSRVPMGSNLTTERLRGVLAAALRALGDRAAGDLGRGDRGRVGALARGSRRVLVRVPPPRDRGDRRGSLRARDRPRRGRRRRRGRPRRGRREPAPRHVAREARRRSRPPSRRTAR